MHTRNGDRMIDARDGKLIARLHVEPAPAAGQKRRKKARRVRIKDRVDLLPQTHRKTCRPEPHARMRRVRHRGARAGTQPEPDAVRLAVAVGGLLGPRTHKAQLCRAGNAVAGADLLRALTQIERAGKPPSVQQKLDRNGCAVGRLRRRRQRRHGHGQPFPVMARRAPEEHRAVARAPQKPDAKAQKKDTRCPKPPVAQKQEDPRQRARHSRGDQRCRRIAKQYEPGCRHRKRSRKNPQSAHHACSFSPSR